MSFFGKISKVDWSKKPVHETVEEAVKSGDELPFRINGIIERVGIISPANYGQICITLNGDSYILSSSHNGGIAGWCSLIMPGDKVELLIDSASRDNYPVEVEHYNIAGLIDHDLEGKFGELPYPNKHKTDRAWSKG